MEDLEALMWKKSSYSGSGGGQCVEVAGHESTIMVRDSKNRNSPVLLFSPAEWDEFVAAVKAQLPVAGLFELWVSA